MSDAQNKNSTSLNQEAAPEVNQQMANVMAGCDLIQLLTEEKDKLDEYSLVPNWRFPSKMEFSMEEPVTEEEDKPKDPWPHSYNEHINSRGKKCIPPCFCWRYPTKEELLEEGWSAEELSPEEELSDKGKSSRKSSKKANSFKNEMCTKGKKPLKKKKSQNKEESFLEKRLKYL